MNNDKLKKSIFKIVSNIPNGIYFDSHYVIECLIKEHLDVYIQCATENQSAENYHSEISKMLKDESLNIKQCGRSLSFNIKGNANKCMLWKKL